MGFLLACFIAHHHRKSHQLIGLGYMPVWVQTALFKKGPSVLCKYFKKFHTTPQTPHRVDL